MNKLNQIEKVRLELLWLAEDIEAAVDEELEITYDNLTAIWNRLVSLANKLVEEPETCQTGEK